VLPVSGSCQGGNETLPGCIPGQEISMRNWRIFVIGPAEKMSYLPQVARSITVPKRRSRTIVTLKKAGSQVRAETTFCKSGTNFPRNLKGIAEMKVDRSASHFDPDILIRRILYIIRVRSKNARKRLNSFNDLHAFFL